ncbi:PaaI family thioesterase [Streptomyces sp. NPDC058001]|uniref:PaaI family thioesterase n=1 Tax=Streptomyces sp. NPDC058001 TaxID=3346300 RepID=UPI0036E64467
MSAQEDHAAAAVRALGHAMVAHDTGDPDLLDRITKILGELTAEVTRCAPRHRDHQADLRAMLGAPPADGAELHVGGLCPVTGAANPLGLAARAHRSGDEAVAAVTFGAASAGAPGVAHGGHVAAVLDGLMGMALIHLAGVPGVTANLRIDYLAPAPVDREVTFRARVTGHEGRKVTITAAGWDGQVCLVRAEALFIVPRQ